MIFFTADTHFYHQNILACCRRPFDTVEEMNGELIRRWNERVRPGDSVYHLGDFSLKTNRGTVEGLLARLNGNKVLIVGNHDDSRTRGAYGWISVIRAGLQPTVIPIPVESGDYYEILVSHHPQESWPVGMVHFHGHRHGGGIPLPGRWDVGVDCWDYRPVTLEEVLAR